MSSGAEWLGGWVAGWLAGWLGGWAAGWLPIREGAVCPNTGRGGGPRYERGPAIREGEGGPSTVREGGGPNGRRHHFRRGGPD